MNVTQPGPEAALVAIQDAERRCAMSHFGSLICSIPHGEQRYPTVGDWECIDDFFSVKVSRLSDTRYEALVALHELIEAVLCRHAGITQASVDAFDIAYEKARPTGDESEPGDDPRAPYYRQHQIATAIERLLAAELGVDWTTYEREVNALG